MTHYRFFILESCQPRKKRERERKRGISTRIKHPSTKDKEKENGKKNSGNKGKKKKEIKHETEVASRDRGATQRSIRAAIQGILVLLVLAYARVRALIPTTGSFIQTYASPSYAFARLSYREWWWEMTERRVVGRSRRRVGIARSGREREKGRQLFNASAGKENEVAAEFSFSRDISLPLAFPSTSPCPIAFSVRLSVSNIEFPLYNSLCPIYRPVYVRTYFWFIRRTLLSSL